MNESLTSHYDIFEYWIQQLIRIKVLFHYAKRETNRR